MASPRTSAIDEAIHVLGYADRKGVVLRLLGGVAFYLRCPSARSGRFARSHSDIDFIGHVRQSSEINHVFEELGYLPRERFNAMHGSRRLGFTDPAQRRRVDVFLDVFEMCHRFDLKDRIEIDPKTIPLADLLATKLQIIETNEKDFEDMICLLLDHELSDTDLGDAINGEYLARLCAEDWGVYKTFTIKLAVLAAAVEEWDIGERERDLVIERIGRLSAAIERAPKNFGWKMRAAVGERLRWYELPEEDMGAVEQVRTGES